MTVEERLETLERQLAATKRSKRRILGAVGLALVGAVLVWIGIGTSRVQADGRPGELHVRRLFVDDEKGRCRVVLNVTRSGPGLVVFDEKGKVRVFLKVPPKVGPRLVLYDEDGRERVRLGVEQLRFADEEDKRHVLVGEGGMVIFDADHRGASRVRWSTP